MKVLVGVLAVASLVVGCAGAHASIIAPGAQIPISLSGGLRDNLGGAILTEHLEPVGTFAAEHRVWATLYSQLPLSGDWDISSEVNHQVSAAGGNAVANLEISSDGCFMNKVFPLTLLPFWAGCAVVRLRGDIYRIAYRTTNVAVPDLPSGAPEPAVQEVLHSHKPEIRACVEDQHERDTRTHGELIAQWTIGSEGEVLGLELSPEFRGIPLAGCVSQMMGAMAFPKSAATQRVTFPFRF